MLLQKLVGPGVSTKEIDAEVETLILSRGATPAFKGYRGYPATVCASINQEVVHGIPSPKRKLKEGDIIGLDLGCIVEGYYGDCAVTLPVGRGARAGAGAASTSRARASTRPSCSAASGNRIGDISHAVQTHCESHGFGVVRSFVGHGIGRALHEEPQVPNFGDAGRGPVLKAGHGARHRAHGHHGVVRSAGARGRLDGGDHGRQPGRPLRGHHRHHGRRAGRADPGGG